LRLCSEEGLSRHLSVWAGCWVVLVLILLLCSGDCIGVPSDSSVENMFARLNRISTVYNQQVLYYRYDWNGGLGGQCFYYNLCILWVVQTRDVPLWVAQLQRYSFQPFLHKVISFLQFLIVLTEINVLSKFCPRNKHIYLNNEIMGWWSSAVTNKHWG
jgi:hypothetical protein